MASQEELLNDLLEATNEQNQLIKDAASDTGWDAVLGTLTKILAFTVDQAKVLDSIGLKNSTLNVSFGKLQEEIHQQGFRFGTMAEHMQMQLNLHKIGYKTINKELRDGLVWLDKADGQGQDLLKFMESMRESGTTSKTQEVIAQHIIEIAAHSAQSARAAIESLSQIGVDNKSILRVLGVEESVLNAILMVSKGQPAVVSRNIGKFMQEILDPKNMAQQFHQGISGPLTDVLMSISASDGEKAEAIKEMIKSTSSQVSKDLQGGGRSLFVLHKIRETLAGQTGMLSLRIGNLEETFGTASTDAMKESNAKSYYDGSLTRMTDVAANTAQLVPIRSMMHSLTKFILGDKFVDPSMGTAAQRSSIDISNFDDDTPWRVGQKSILNYLPDWMGGIGTQAGAYHSALDKFKRDTHPLMRDDPDAYDQKKAVEQMRLRSEGKPYDIRRDGEWISSTKHKRNIWKDPFPSVESKGTGTHKSNIEDFSSNPFMNAAGEPITVQLQQNQVKQMAPTPPVVPIVMPGATF